MLEDSRQERCQFNVQLADHEIFTKYEFNYK